MIDIDWLSDRLCDALRWQLANPGKDNGPEIPVAGRRVWSIFVDLNRGRGSGGFGPSPISYGEIEAWSRLRREPVRPFELDILQALDAAFLKATAERSELVDDKQVVSDRPLTPALFRAVMGAR